MPLTFVDGRAHSFCSDSQIGSIPRSYLFDDVHPQHSLVLAIRDPDGTALGCAQLEKVKPLTGRTQFATTGGIFGDFLFWQTGPDDRTYIRAHVTGLRNDDYSLRIYENALMGQECTFNVLGDVLSRMNGEFFLPPDAESGGLGNLDALIPLDNVQFFRDTVSTNSVPLFGHNSVLDHTLVLVRETNPETIVACGDIMRQMEYPRGEIASLQGYQDANNPPLPPPR